MSPSAKFQIRTDLLLSSVLVGSMLFAAASARAIQPAKTPDRAALLGTAPLYFEAQNAQSFVARGQDCGIQLSATGATMILGERNTGGLLSSDRQVLPERRISSARTIRLTLLGARAESELTGIGQLPGKANYLLGNDSSAWRTGIPLFAKVQVGQVYPGIDVIYYADQSAHLEYDFILQPKANPDQVAFRIEGADCVRIDARGDLVLAIGSEEIRQHRPVIYQDVNGVRKEIPGGYRLTGGNTVAFRVGEYDRNLPLVIDPTLTFSTYLGGAKADNAWAIAVDGNGDVYVAGETLSKDLLITSNAYSNRYAGGYGSFGDAFIAKYDAVSNALVYLTYFGGRANDSAMALAVTNGNVFVTGFTDSRNFPIVPANNPVALETLAHSGRTNNAFRLYPVN
ncbi:MAG TPA: SBBP repeat-containing protein, partial [Candidatus Paceibacterota bacterium]|nr:SBBP repeat-containing protein [Candidatus Paceibacterota bacterium]